MASSKPGNAFEKISAKKLGLNGGRIEVKSKATPRPAMASGLKIFQEDFGDKTLPGYVVHPGDVTLPLGKGVIALSFDML